MKLFQQLLVAPAALGLLAPLAANAAEVNINDVAGYADTSAEVSTAQFSDVVPGDWAYTALQNLSESYGCVDNSYSQNLKSGQALTRYEAAALVNACLEGGVASVGIDSDAARLSNEFGTEMAILKGRVDGLEYKSSEFNAGQFASATKVNGGAVFTLGAVDGATTGQALAMQYAFSVDMNSSWAPGHNLYAGIETGNAAAPLLMDSATTGSQTLKLHTLSYQFPVADSFTVTAGPLVKQDFVIASTGSVYDDSFRLNAFPYTSGNDAVVGGGAGVEWADDSGFVASAAFISDNAEDATKGLATDQSSDIVTLSAGYNTDTWGAGVVYSSDDTAGATGTANGGNHATGSFGLGLYFQPEGFPTISFAYDNKSPGDAAIKDSTDYLIGVNHEVGAGTLGAAYQSNENAGATSLASYELYYNYPVNDGVSIQGGVFVEEQAGTAEDHTGVVVETFFTF